MPAALCARPRRRCIIQLDVYRRYLELSHAYRAGATAHGSGAHAIDADMDVHIYRRLQRTHKLHPDIAVTDGPLAVARERDYLQRLVRRLKRCLFPSGLLWAVLTSSSLEPHASALQVCQHGRADVAVAAAAAIAVANARLLAPLITCVFGRWPCCSGTRIRTGMVYDCRAIAGCRHGNAA